MRAVQRDDVAAALDDVAGEVVGDRAAPGELRFAVLRRRIPGISQKMLSTTDNPSPVSR